ncbi:DNA-directed RNA polymerase subunit M [Candidatus Acidianus copahuensis]|uniref:DNA-directed RNA polymerase subunit M n=1 Tax=Candidatus Acidianus copahuensis TaxID=1160895 RepID=UPI0009DFCCE7|nr:DNA-directed RNA polymerase subunit M [Candidatus Acidianus copahuensis]
MKFCPKCGSAMIPRREYSVCMKCGHKEKGSETTRISTQVKVHRESMIVADGKRIQGSVSLALCPRCGNAVSSLINRKKSIYKCRACGYIFTIKT